MWGIDSLNDYMIIDLTEKTHSVYFILYKRGNMIKLTIDSGDALENIPMENSDAKHQLLFNIPNEIFPYLPSYTIRNTASTYARDQTFAVQISPITKSIDYMGANKPEYYFGSVYMEFIWFI